MPTIRSNVFKVTILARVLLFCGDNKLIEKYTDYKEITSDDFKKIILDAHEVGALVSYVTDDRCAKHAKDLLGIDVLSKEISQEFIKKAVFYKFLWDENKNRWVYRKYFTEYNNSSTN